MILEILGFNAVVSTECNVVVSIKFNIVVPTKCNVVVSIKLNVVSTEYGVVFSGMVPRACLRTWLVWQTWLKLYLMYFRRNVPILQNLCKQLSLLYVYRYDGFSKFTVILDMGKIPCGWGQCYIILKLPVTYLLFYFIFLVQKGCYKCIFVFVHE